METWGAEAKAPFEEMGDIRHSYLITLPTSSRALTIAYKGVLHLFFFPSILSNEDI